MSDFWVTFSINQNIFIKKVLKGRTDFVVTIIEFLHLPDCLFVCLFVCLFICLFVCLFVCQSVCYFNLSSFRVLNRLDNLSMHN